MDESHIQPRPMGQTMAPLPLCKTPSQPLPSGWRSQDLKPEVFTALYCPWGMSHLRVLVAQRALGLPPDLLARSPLPQRCRMALFFSPPSFSPILLFV